ncbi:MerR family transcriptional regulator [Amycolatopsis antarctica]|uniref:MerR family transcriptional regulator n=1 Tax=Amycolatopsis antarctica TaxID=1854586 RepID=A0A263CVV0_9PSEU|nr:MerR family transcriptional regulator [Amycolatopsis antarctica]OZM70270.1 MerR family transcriptional regulator [Amycolatopsis antarctica]
MAWNTRQVAELAGTNLRTVRHYHELGLLAEPERRHNGDTYYGMTELMGVLRIRRLTELGYSLRQIAALDRADKRPGGSLRSVDATLAATVDRLRRARFDLAIRLRGDGSARLPSEAAAAGLSEADRAFSAVMAEVLSPPALDAYAEILRNHRGLPDSAEFDGLPPDADEQTRRELAERLAPQARGLLAEHPGLRDPSVRSAANTIEHAIDELYNPAQVDVLGRVRRALRDTGTSAARR